MKYTVIAYYTRNTLYEREVETLRESLKRFNIPYYISAIENKGDWYKNTCYKPIFIKEMLLKFPDKSLIYIDVDAEFKQYPTLFDTLCEDSDINICIHMLDRGCYRKSQTGILELLSGTIFMNNTIATKVVVDLWEIECINNPRKWDQRSLAAVINSDFHNLPEEYCTIYDTMSYVKNPVIVHYQKSRVVRRNKGKLI